MIMKTLLWHIFSGRKPTRDQDARFAEDEDDDDDIFIIDEYIDSNINRQYAHLAVKTEG